MKLSTEWFIMIGTEGKMKPVYAHIILFLFDVFCFFGLYWFYSDYLEIERALKAQADFVEYLTHMHRIIYIIFIPLLHIYAILKLIFPKLDKYEVKVLIMAVVVTLGSSFLAAYHINNKLGNSGYIKCPYANHNWRITTYTRTMDICKERRESLRN